MNIPEEFGSYLLLKKLREDALGETFRGGRVGGDAIDQVVLLRVFNGQGIDGEKLWQRVSGRTAVHQALRSPNIGSGVDLGKVRSFPYTAYDYISGKNLATLFAQAERQRQPIPIDHALLISERLALALAAAYETRVQDERVLHGFVTPHLVMISNEGETRLLGFEVAPGLRELWAGGWRNDDLRGYLAPEATATTVVGKNDDVYSLGAILFELLSSERLPAPPAGGYAPLIDAMVMPSEGLPLPADIAALLKQSLAPREQRIPDAITWHKTISKLMIDGQYSSTTFNLAFFMHNLFRDEIDRETQEIEAEKKLELPSRQGARPAGPAGTGAAAVAATAAWAAAGAASSAGAAGAADARERTAVREAGWAATPAGPGAALPGGAAVRAGAGAAADRKPLWIAVAAGALVLLGVGGYFLFGRSGSGAAKPAAAAGAAAPLAPGAAGGTAAADAAKNAAALQAQIQQMIEARSKEMESKLKDQYNEEIKGLQKKLDDSRKAAAEQDKEKARADRQAAAGPSDSAPATAAPEGRAARGDKAERADAASATSAAGSTGAPAVPGSSSRLGQTAAQPSAAAAGAAQRDAAAAGATPGAAGSAGAAAGATAPAPGSGAAAEASPARLPQLQAGDLVQPGPGVVMPRVVSRPSARYPAAARHMNKSAEVVVRVLVDERGRVEDVERQGGAVGLGFDEAAIEVARHSSYEPASKNGVRVKMWTTMKVNFKPVS